MFVSKGLLLLCWLMTLCASILTLFCVVYRAMCVCFQGVVYVTMLFFLLCRLSAR